VVCAHLFNDSAGESTLLLVAHHLVVDGWSCWLLLKDLQELYTAEIRGEQSSSQAAAPSRYVDFVRWEEELVASTEGERLWSYWQRELSGELPVLRLFGGSSALLAPTFRGASHHFELSSELVDGLKALAQAEGTTLYTLLLAAFQVMLHRYTGQDDILVGSPVAARTRPEFEAVVGCFFNAVVLRGDLSGDPTFKKLLGQMRTRVLGALDHQNYPSHLLTQRLRQARDHGRRQLFQVFFNLQKVVGLDSLASATPRRGVDDGATELVWSLVPLERRGARAELELELIESEGLLAGLLQYSTELCDAAGAKRLGHHYQNLLESIVAHPSERISRLALLDEPESRLLVNVWSTSGKVDRQPVCVHEIFDRQVEQTPDKLAAVDAHRSLTFRDLGAQVDQLASLIRGLTR
jgi:non-ribosomal peptide synthetase component F